MAASEVAGMRLLYARATVVRSPGGLECLAEGRSSILGKHQQNAAARCLGQQRLGERFGA